MFFFPSFICTHLLDCGIDLPFHSALLSFNIQVVNTEEKLKVWFLRLGCLGLNPRFATLLAVVTFSVSVSSSVLVIYGYITNHLAT